MPCGRKERIIEVYKIIQLVETPVDFVDFVDRERYAQRVSQLSITSMAGYKDDGQTYARMYAAKDCRLSKGLPFLLAEGYKLAIVKEEK